MGMYMNANPDPEGMSRDSAYWAHRYVFSVAKIMYSHAMSNVTAVQHELEDAAVRLVSDIDTKMAAGGIIDAAHLTTMYTEHAERVLRSFWALPDLIVARYSDGWLADKANVGYSDWWLKAVGYEQGPASIPDVPPPSTVATTRSQCDAAGVHGCIALCPSSVGFATCAVKCTRSCETPEASALLV